MTTAHALDEEQADDSIKPPPPPSKVKMPEDQSYDIRTALEAFQAASTYFLHRKRDYETAQRDADRANNRADKLGRDLVEAEKCMRAWKEVI
jgi:hypothetical protein